MRSSLRRHRVLATIGVTLALSASTACTGPATPGGQPSDGPTGATTATATLPATTGTDAPETSPSASVGPTDPSETPAPVPSASATQATGNVVGVVVTSSGWSTATDAAEVTGYVAVLEQGGTCTARLSRGDVVVEVAQEALPDATTTSCGTISVPHSRLTSGRWDAEIRYGSPVSAGSSERVEITVP